MVTIKTKKEIEIIREGGKKLAEILKTLSKEVVPGVSTKHLNDIAHKMAIENGDRPAFLGYKTGGARPYPSSLCVSINDEIVHGISNENPKIIKEGDIVSLDMGLIHKNLVTDSAISVIAGKGDEQAKKLLAVTEEALYAGIKAVKVGGTIGDIGFAIQEVAKRNEYSIVEELSGHGVGYKIHEDPYVPNFGKKGEGLKLKSGMVIAIEPMFNEGLGGIVLVDDGWTFKTVDGKRSAHFEHTIAVTENGADILTK